MKEALKTLLGSVGVKGTGLASLTLNGQDPVLDSRFRLGETATVALAATGIAAADIWNRKSGETQDVQVDVAGAAASLISFFLQKLDGPETPLRITNPTQALYQTNDGRWIHLHGGFPHLAEGTLAILKCGNTEKELAKAVAKWDPYELEDTLADARMCGAVARTANEWREHPQGKALLNEPPVKITKIADSDPIEFPHGDRPLSGIRVLDLTRVLAGPTCARTLAAHGADVLKINSPNLDSILPFVMDTGHGKRSAFLDLNDKKDERQLLDLIGSADVFSQGYRNGALARRGLGSQDLAERRPGIVYVSINCYGHVGPWATRPGWEQLAQTATGIAVEEGGEKPPRLVPAAATDYTTGYLAALGAMAALIRRAEEGGSYHVEASLCQTAMWLQDQPRLAPDVPPPPPLTDIISKYMTRSETPFGSLSHLGPIVELSATPARWEQPTVPLGTHQPSWLSKQ